MDWARSGVICARDVLWGAWPAGPALIWGA